jgi:hypothetical protein
MDDTVVDKNTHRYLWPDVGDGKCAFYASYLKHLYSRKYRLKVRILTLSLFMAILYKETGA